MLITLIIICHYFLIQPLTQEGQALSVPSTLNNSTLSPESDTDLISSILVESPIDLLSSSQKEIFQKLLNSIQKNEISSVKSLVKLIKKQLSPSLIFKLFSQTDKNNLTPLHTVIKNNSTTILKALTPLFSPQYCNQILTLKKNIEEKEISPLQMALSSLDEKLIIATLDFLNKKEITQEVIQQFTIKLNAPYKNIVHFLISKKNLHVIQTISEILPYNIFIDCLYEPIDTTNKVLFFPLIKPHPDCDFFINLMALLKEETLQNILTFRITLQTKRLSLSGTNEVYPIQIITSQCTLTQLKNFKKTVGNKIFAKQMALKGALFIALENASFHLKQTQDFFKEVLCDSTTEAMIKIINSKSFSGMSIKMYIIKNNLTHYLDLLFFKKEIIHHFLLILSEDIINNRVSRNGSSTYERFIRDFLKKTLELENLKIPEKDSPHSLIDILSFKRKEQTLNILQSLLEKKRIDLLPNTSSLSSQHIQFILTQIQDINSLLQVPAGKSFFEHPQVIIEMTQEQLQHLSFSFQEDHDFQKNKDLFLNALSKNNNDLISHFITLTKEEKEASGSLLLKILSHPNAEEKTPFYIAIEQNLTTISQIMIQNLTSNELIHLFSLHPQDKPSALHWVLHHNNLILITLIFKQTQNRFSDLLSQHCPSIEFLCQTPYEKILQLILSWCPQQKVQLLIQKTPQKNNPECRSPFELIFQRGQVKFIQIIQNTCSYSQIKDLFLLYKEQNPQQSLYPLSLAMKNNPDSLTFFLQENHKLLKECPHIFYDAYQQDPELFQHIYEFLQQVNSLKDFFFKSNKTLSRYERYIILPTINPNLSKKLEDLYIEIIQCFKSNHSTISTLIRTKVYPLSQEERWTIFSQINPQTGMTFLQEIVQKELFNLLSYIQKYLFKDNPEQWVSLIVSQPSVNPQHISFFKCLKHLKTALHVAIQQEKTHILSLLLQSIPPHRIEPILQLKIYKQETLLETALKSENFVMIDYILNEPQLLKNHLFIIFDLIKNNHPQLTKFLQQILNDNSTNTIEQPHLPFQLLSLKDDQNRTLLDPFYYDILSPFIDSLFKKLSFEQIIYFLPELHNSQQIASALSILQLTEEIDCPATTIELILKSQNNLLIQQACSLISESLASESSQEKTLNWLTQILTLKNSHNESLLSLCQEKDTFNLLQNTIEPYRQQLITLIHQTPSLHFNTETFNFLFQKSSDFIDNIQLLFDSLHSIQYKTTSREFVNLFIKSLKDFSNKDPLLIHKIICSKDQDENNILTIIIKENIQEILPKILSLIPQEFIFKIIFDNKISKLSVTQCIIQYNRYHFLDDIFKYCKQSDIKEILLAHCQIACSSDKGATVKDSTLFMNMCYHEKESFEFLKLLSPSDTKEILCFQLINLKYRAIDIICAMPNMSVLSVLKEHLSPQDLILILSSICNGKNCQALLHAFISNNLNLFKFLFEKDLTFDHSLVIPLIKEIEKGNFDIQKEHKEVYHFLQQCRTRCQTPQTPPKKVLLPTTPQRFLEKSLVFISLYPKNYPSFLDFIKSQKPHYETGSTDFKNKVMTLILSKQHTFHLNDKTALTTNFLGLATFFSPRKKLIEEILEIDTQLRKKSSTPIQSILFPDKENPSLSPIWLTILGSMSNKGQHLECLQLLLLHCNSKDFSEWATSFFYFEKDLFETFPFLEVGKISPKIYNLFLEKIDNETLISTLLTEKSTFLSVFFDPQFQKRTQLSTSQILERYIRPSLKESIPYTQSLNPSELIKFVEQNETALSFFHYQFFLRYNNTQNIEKFLLKLNFDQRSYFIISILQSHTKEFLQILEEKKDLPRLLYSSTEALLLFFKEHCPLIYQQIFSYSPEEQKIEQQLTKAFEEKNWPLFVEKIYRYRTTPSFRNRNPILILFECPQTRTLSLELFKEFHKQRQLSPLIYDKLLWDALGEDKNSTLHHFKYLKADRNKNLRKLKTGFTTFALENLKEEYESINRDFKAPVYQPPSPPLSLSLQSA